MAGSKSHHHPDHEYWRANTGAAVTLDHADASSAATATHIDVLSWNVAIGKGRLLERIRSLLQVRAQVGMTRPLVVLVQEAFRSDESVPELHATDHHGGLAPRANSTREDVTEVARALNLSLRYAPSMRNGRHRSDRGNAILSSVPIEESVTITLPHVRQHRASVAARITFGNASLWFASAHLDTRGRHRPHATRADDGHVLRTGFGAGRAVQAAALGDALIEHAGPDAAIILGGDLNSYIGLRDPAVKALVEHGFHHAARVGKWRHTFHGPLRLMLDHVLFRTGSSINGVDVRRLDEGFDRGHRVFGSDHHPLLATIALRSPA